ncbi:uncharacterized protein si:ch211-142k18.1 [Melanotaenia boesemani]|uniref:uncharacterized protein si:ch211-142k18.1 n=1 Tax=Melanotaenia boesemani TaxID=1250792 RepID=UPI001C0404F8|nr:uncharacterized protein si:ch211-142k18.1 [Melanotaenia boesemani]
MWHCWMKFILAWVSLATPLLGQSGDGEWGSGYDIHSAIIATNDTVQAVGDEPAKVKSNHDWSTTTSSLPSSSPLLHYDPRPDMCSVHFSTNTAGSARRLKAQREEVAYLQAIQHGNKAVVENLEQFIGAELGDQCYEDVIKENIIGIQEDHKSCNEVVEKAKDDLKKQFEGDNVESLAGMQKIREEALVFEDMLRAAADIASRLESSLQTLHASFTRQLKDMAKIHR